MYAIGKQSGKHAVPVLSCYRAYIGVRENAVLLALVTREYIISEYVRSGTNMTGWCNAIPSQLDSWIRAHAQSRASSVLGPISCAGRFDGISKAAAPIFHTQTLTCDIGPSRYSYVSGTELSRTIVGVARIRGTQQVSRYFSGNSIHIVAQMLQEDKLHDCVRSRAMAQTDCRGQLMRAPPRLCSCFKVMKANERDPHVGTLLGRSTYDMHMQANESTSRQEYKAKT
jgi:hypothetical protein